MERFTVSVDSSGRILLPARIRRQLQLEPGTKLIGEVKDEQLVLWTQAQAIRKAQAYFSQFRPKTGKLWSEELIEERREEARRELEE